MPVAKTSIAASIVRIIFWGGLLLVIGALVMPSGFLDRGGDRSRSKVSRVKSDLRSLETAIETYKLDHGVYPEVAEYADHWRTPNISYPARPEGAGIIAGITTPIAYLTSHFADPFAEARGETFVYFRNGDGWLLISPGPDKVFQILHPADVYSGLETDIETVAANLAPYTYDRNNGTDSSGDIWRAKQ